MTGKFVKIKPGDEVVISGIAGRFPESDNLLQLQENLFNKVDLVTDDERRWKSGHPNIPQRTGKVNNLEKFDSEFFGTHPAEAHVMDPMSRMLLEHAYESIIDAGVNPQQLRGTNTGIFAGGCFSESEHTWFYDIRPKSGFGLPGCSRSVMVNRISDWLGCTGPSYSVDTACSSSLAALYHAYNAMRRGECDAALVAGCNLCLFPQMSLQYSILGVLSSDGRCKSFDSDGRGYCRSEAVCIIYLQKAKDAKRVYAQVVHTKVNCDGFKEEGITHPSSEMQRDLLEQLYDECGVPPSTVAYVETHGTGTKVGDPVESDAIAKVFCPGRTSSLRIGSLKSNLGHTEPASGICAIAKVIIAMESGYIPPNLHYNLPRQEIPALSDGRMKVVTELTPWDGGYVGVSSFGFGGTNAHVLLRSNQKEKIRNGAPADVLSRLVVVSGRTEEAVITLLDKLESRPVDVEYVSLFHNIHAAEIQGHLYRGYTVLPTHGLPQKSIRDVRAYSDARRPVCFMFFGMGSRWSEMGGALLRIPAFAKATEKCQATLQPYGLNVIDILTNEDPQIFDNILNSFVGTAVMQIGLVDVLTCVRIVPDFSIGQSVGELGCAYASGCLTAEQVVLAAYFQGLASLEGDLIRRSEATVRLGVTELASLCPSDIDIVCHDGLDNTTISGPARSVEALVARLQKQDIAARVGRYHHIGYHSRSVETIGPKLFAYLQEVISDPKPRGQKWLGTSTPYRNLETDSAGLCSPEYLANSLLNSVSIENAYHSVPNNAIVIEMVPHDSLQTTRRMSLSKNVIDISLTERGREDNDNVLLQAIGKLYEAGLHPQLTNLYPRIRYPVSRGTPMISPFVRWDHSDSWSVSCLEKQESNDSGERTVDITLSKMEFEWMAGHVIDGRILVPGVGYLTLIWETFATMRGEFYAEVSVVFENVRFLRATTIPSEDSVRLVITIQKGSGRFEAIEGGAVIVTGFIRAVSNATPERVDLLKSTANNDELVLTSDDIYKELRLRGYNYGGLFRGLRRASLDRTAGRIEWVNNWGAFIDNMLQMKLIGMDTRELSVLTSIQKIVIDTTLHMNQLHNLPVDKKVFAAKFHKDTNIIVSGGVEIRGSKFTTVGRQKISLDPIIEDYKFVAHKDRSEMKLKDLIHIVIQIVTENTIGRRLKTIEVIDHDNISSANLASPLIEDILRRLPLIQADVNVIAPDDKFSRQVLPSAIKTLGPKNLASESGAHLVVSHRLFTKKYTKILKLLKLVMSDRGFLLAREPLDTNTDIGLAAKSHGFCLVLEKRTKNELVILLRKMSKQSNIALVIRVNNDEFTWLAPLKEALKSKADERNFDGQILLISEGESESGLQGLVNCLRREPGGEYIQGLLIQDLQAPKFSANNSLYSEQLKLGLTLNVLRTGKSWGSYRFLGTSSHMLRFIHHARMQQDIRGDLSSIEWVQGVLKSYTQNTNIIRVHYSPINFRDVMLSTAKLPVAATTKPRHSQERMMGIEFSGKDANGRAVIGITNTGSFSNFCICDTDMLWTVPNNWTLEDAATVPIAYGTAYYALIMTGKMQKGQKVLIHAGSGGVGQAAITLALDAGCEVFTTVGTAEKREFIKTHFPQIDDEHIGNSRDTSFEQLVIRKTRGQGVNIVLNSLSEEKLQASVRCLTAGGRFLEIGAFDLAANNPLGTEAFLKGISFHGIFLNELFDSSSERKTKLVEMLATGIESGVVKPLPRIVFPMDQVETAFRYMAAGKHIGKVIVKIRSEDHEAQLKLPLALPRFYCLENCSYLIHGGLGGFGMELVNWLVLRGARKIVLTSRRGVRTGYQRMRINIWKSYGVTVVIVAGKDASTHEGCEAILQKAIALGPVSGIFNLAMVLFDALFENQTDKTFEESFRVKAWTTKHLDRLSRVLCPDLKHFVVFSSIVCSSGNAGQTNYGMSNSVMERICESRVADGLPGLAIQWGTIGEVGVVAEMHENNNKEVIICGTQPQKMSSCLRELDFLLHHDSPVVSSIVISENKPDSARVASVVYAVAKIMDLKDLKTVNFHTSLAELGLDSMMTVEVKQTLEREFNVFMTAANIRRLTFNTLPKLEINYRRQIPGIESAMR